MAHIGTRIRARRKELKLTQADLAARLGYRDKSTIAKIEAGINDITQSRVVQFADALETTVSYLLGDNEEDTKKAPSPISEEDAQILAAFHAAGERDRRMILYMLGIANIPT